MNSLGEQSLKVRVGKIIAIFSILMVAFYTSLLAELYRSGLTEATHSILRQESSNFKKAHSIDPNTPVPRSSSLNGYVGAENVPDEIKRIYPEDKWEMWPRSADNIMYRYIKNTDTESHYHFIILDLENTDKRLYMTYTITVSDEQAGGVWRRLTILSIVGGVGVIILLLFFRQIILHAISPLSSLSNWIEKLDQDQPPSALPTDLRDDEIGQVAQSLYDALQRIHQHNKRESQFLRNASHELRTPIAIIRNAMDVIEYKQQANDSNLDPLLQRIRRAGDSMKSVTEAILWLAVDRYTAPEKTSIDINQLIEELIADNKSIITSKNIDVDLQLNPSEPITIEKVLVHISLDNIIRNAFQHCDDGKVKIVTQDNCIEITNHNPAFGHGSEHGNIRNTMQTGGFGLGLALVDRIANKQGWMFEFELAGEDAISRLTLHTCGINARSELI